MLYYYDYDSSCGGVFMDETVSDVATATADAILTDRGSLMGYLPPMLDAVATAAANVVAVAATATATATAGRSDEKDNFSKSRNRLTDIEEGVATFSLDTVSASDGIAEQHDDADESLNSQSISYTTPDSMRMNKRRGYQVHGHDHRTGNGTGRYQEQRNDLDGGCALEQRNPYDHPPSHSQQRPQSMLPKYEMADGTLTTLVGRPVLSRQASLASTSCSSMSSVGSSLYGGSQHHHRQSSVTLGDFAYAESVSVVKRNHVTFSTVTVRKIPHRSSFTKDEKRSTWYNVREFQTMRQSAVKLARSVETAESSSKERGLERLGKAAVKKLTARRRALNAELKVLRELGWMESDRSHLIVDDLAELFQSYTKVSAHEARVTGLQDEKCAYEYYHDDFIAASSVPSSSSSSLSSSNDEADHIEKASTPVNARSPHSGAAAVAAASGRITSSGGAAQKSSSIGSYWDVVPSLLFG